MRAYAQVYAADEVLADGTNVHVRAIRADDKGRLLELFGGLSARTCYFRFFGNRRRLTREDLVRLTELDFNRRVGVAAEIRQNGRECITGVGRYIRKEIPSRAEIALAILGAYQDIGIGPLLIRHLGRIARASGVTLFAAGVRDDNSRMLTILRASECVIQHANGAGIVHFTLRCPEITAVSVNYGKFDYTGRWIASPKGDNNG